VTTRRGLLAAGAGAGLLAAAGCGPPDDPPPDAELLRAPLEAELALVEAYERVGGRLGRELGARAAEHVERLRAAGAAPADGAAVPAGEPLEAALALERRGMAAYVTAVGDVRDAGRRVLVAELLTAGAQHASLLLDRLGRDPLPSAFPDGRTA
jgi:hypothetical protein